MYLLTSQFSSQKESSCKLRVYYVYNSLGKYPERLIYIKIGNAKDIFVKKSIFIQSNVNAK